jgi:hypothetical protein
MTGFEGGAAIRTVAFSCALDKCMPVRPSLPVDVHPTTPAMRSRATVSPESTAIVRDDLLQAPRGRYNDGGAN